MPMVLPESLKRIKLWRYMGLEKLLGILQSRSLYFPRLGSFQDPYEGMVPNAWQGAVTDVSQLPGLNKEWEAVPLSFPDGKHLRDENLPDELYVSCM